MKVKLLKQTARELAATGQIVEPGQTVDLPRPLAESLLEQPDVWGKPTTRKTTKTDKPDDGEND